MSPEDLVRVKDLLAEGKLINAIKVMRELTALGLKDAKELVEAVRDENLDYSDFKDRLLDRGWQPRSEASASLAAEAGDDRDYWDLLQRGKKIAAIKLYRERNGVGLKEAKHFIDNLSMGGPGAAAKSVAGGAFEVDEEITDLVRAGRKIEAIKAYRERTGVGLKEAKAAIDAVAEELE